MKFSKLKKLEKLMKRQQLGLKKQKMRQFKKLKRENLIMKKKIHITE